MSFQTDRAVESHEQDWKGRPDTRGDKLLAAPLAGIV
jgi:hypothetical protein